MNNQHRNILPESYVKYFTKWFDVPVTLTTNGLKFWIRFHGLNSLGLTDKELTDCVNLAMRRRNCDPGHFYVGHYDFSIRKEAAA